MPHHLTQIAVLFFLNKPIFSRLHPSSDSVRKLFEKQFKANQGKGAEEKPIDIKLKKAYLTNEQTRQSGLGS